jgi:hypothetical protein
MAAGSHTVSFDAVNLAGGVYYYSLQQAGLRVTKKMVLMK